MTNDYGAARKRSDDAVCVSLADFQTDAALHTLLPLALVNGTGVARDHVECAMCSERFYGDRVYGRVLKALPPMITVSASGIYDRYSRLTHIDSRFRATPTDNVIEWLGGNGIWQAWEMNPPTPPAEIMRAERRVLRFVPV